MSQQQDTTADTKRKKESLPFIAVPVNELHSHQGITLLMECGIEGYGILMQIRSFIRSSPSLNVRSTVVQQSLEWIARVDQQRTKRVIEVCLEVGLLIEDKDQFDTITCPLVVEDVRKYDERREQLIRAGKISASKRSTHVQRKLNTTSTRDEHTKVRKGKVRIGKEENRKEELDHVNIPHDEELKLQSEITADEYEYWRQALTEYAKTHPAKWRKYKDHAAVLRSWRRKRIEEGYTWDSDKKIYQRVNGYLSAQDQRAKRNKEFLEKLARGEDV